MSRFGYAHLAALGHIDWIKEAKSLIQKQAQHEIVDKAAVRRTIQQLEHIIHATESFYSRDGMLDPRIMDFRLPFDRLEEVKDIYQQLVGIAKWIRA